MLPPFDESGNLPPGIHPCDTGELVAKFGSGSPERKVETQELLDFLAWARNSDVKRVIINGSYVTTQTTPNDIDIAILPGLGYPRIGLGSLEQEIRWPFLQILVAADESDLLEWSLQDFGTDRNGRAKGVVEILL